MVRVMEGQDVPVVYGRRKNQIIVEKWFWGQQGLRQPTSLLSSFIMINKRSQESDSPEMWLKKSEKHETK